MRKKILKKKTGMRKRILRKKSGKDFSQGDFFLFFLLSELFLDVYSGFMRFTFITNKQRALTVGLQ
jgi:hypothetical protein